MTLHDIIESDGLNVFCNADDFAEAVTYYPRDGASREINVVVIRNQLGLIPEDVDVVNPSMEVHVHNSETTGISSSELNLGGDYLEFPSRVGKDPERRSIVRLIDHDEGMLVLECR